MKKIIIIVCLIGSGLIILDSINFGSALAGFLLGGVVPYTNLVVTPDQTLSLVFFISGFLLSRAMMALITRIPQRLARKSAARA